MSLTSYLKRMPCLEQSEFMPSALKHGVPVRLAMTQEMTAGSTYYYYGSQQSNMHPGPQYIEQV